MNNPSSLAGIARLALKLEAFDSLRAEEEPWLNQVFVPPSNAEQIAGDRSVVVFGHPGSGKTALSQYLRRLCRSEDGTPNRLVAEWSPSPTVEAGLSRIAVVQAQARQVLDACVEAALQFAAANPTSVQSAPPTSVEGLTWFVHEYSQSDLSLRVEQMIEEKKLPGETLLRDIVNASPRKVLPLDASPDKVAARLVRILNTMGLKGVWVIGNDAELEMWAEIDPDDLVARLNSFFSTLPLFEKTNFNYKLLLPASLEQKILAVLQTMRQRQRIFAYYLNEWDRATLLELVNRRLSLAMGQPDFTLAKLCRAPELLKWLEWVGDASPREWLAQIKPLVEHYLTGPAKKPISLSTWYELRRKYPPRLYLDDEGKRITVGARQISLEGLPAKAYEMLRYLYQQPGDSITSKADLYYRVYLGQETVPAIGEKGYEGPEEYRGVVDTNLWRIRKAIEPDQSGRHHVLLLTLRGHGVRLNTRW